MGYRLGRKKTDIFYCTYDNAEKFDIVISTEKTQYLKINKELKRSKLAASNQSMKQVKNLRYLGNITSSSDLTKKKLNNRPMESLLYLFDIF